MNCKCDSIVAFGQWLGSFIIGGGASVIDWISGIVYSAETMQIIISSILALATIILAIFTAVLVQVTKRKPFVICSTQFRFDVTHTFNLVIKNTGNATAFDIKINISTEKPDVNGVLHIDKTEINHDTSILPPEQDYTLFNHPEPWDFPVKKFNITISWALKPKGRRQKPLIYIIDKDKSFKGKWEESGSHKIARELKEIKEHFKNNNSTDCQ